LAVAPVVVPPVAIASDLSSRIPGRCGDGWGVATASWRGAGSLL